MPEIRPSIFVPQPVNQELQLPVAFPPLPRVMVERFGKEAKEYEEAMQTFWTRTRRVLADLRFDVTAPVNKVVQETKSVVEHMEQFDEGLIIVSDGVRLGAAAILVEMQLRQDADDNLSGMYTLKVTAGSVVTGMVITSASGPGTIISEIIFQTNVLKVQTATGPVITLLHIAPTGIVFGTDISSNNFVSGPTGAGWRLTRDTGILECNNGLFRGAIYADDGLIGGFTIDDDRLYAGTGVNKIEMNPSSDIGFMVGTQSPGPYAQLSLSAGWPAVTFANTTGTQVARLGIDGLFQDGSIILVSATGGNSAVLKWDGLKFNFDTNLYRLASNKLKTDGSIDAASFNAVSSIRFKENLRPLGGALDLIEQLQGYRFDWKDGRATDDIGLIAEEVGAIFPTFIGRDSKSRIASLDYAKLTTVLVEAVKELAKRVDGLEHSSQRG
jgi:hypothetical protein